MFEDYKSSRGFAGMMRHSFGFKSEGEFYKTFEDFCQKYMKTLINDQGDQGNEALTAGYLDADKKLDYDNCFYRITNIAMDKSAGKAWGNAIRLFSFTPEVKKGFIDMRQSKYNLLLVPSLAVSSGGLKATIVTPDGKYSTPDPHFAQICTQRGLNSPVKAQVALLYRPAIENETIGSNWWVDVVALFEPQKTVTASYDNATESLLVYPNVKPPEKLVRNGFLTGMQIVVKNNKNGEQKTLSMSVKSWNKSVPVVCSELGIKPSDGIDITLTSRWYYVDKLGGPYFSPATEAVKFNQKGTGTETDKKEPQGSLSFEVRDEAVFDCDYGEVSGVPTLNFAIKGNDFTLNVPGHTIKRKSKYNDSGSYLVATLEMQSFTVEGKIVVKDIGGKKHYYIVDRGALKVTPIKYKHTETVYNANGEMWSNVVTKATVRYTPSPNSSHSISNPDYLLYGPNKKLEFMILIDKGNYIEDKEWVEGGDSGKSHYVNEATRLFTIHGKNVVEK